MISVMRIFFQKSKVTDFAKKKFGEILSEPAQKELQSYLETHEAKITDFFVDILNPEKDQRSFDQRLQSHQDSMMEF